MAMEISDAETGIAQPQPGRSVRRLAGVVAAGTAAACLGVVAWTSYGRGGHVGYSLQTDGTVMLGNMDVTCNEADILNCCPSKGNGMYCCTYTNSTVTDLKVTLGCLHGHGIQTYYDECKSLDYLHNSCFPGSAEVDVQGVGAVPIANIRVGDHVRVSADDYEPVLGHLHKPQHTEGMMSEYLTVAHSCGQFRATANHLVFANGGSKAVAELRAGDRLVGASGETCEVRSLERSTSPLGLHAPLTASGKIVVDGILASVYATPATHLHLAHSLAHAAFFPVRACHALGLCGGSSAAASEEFHPFVALMYKHLRLQKYLSPVSHAL